MMSSSQSIQATADVPWLFGRAANRYSQFGEDGLIEAIFEKVGMTNLCCFEVGAADGLFYSNTLQWREKGWRAVLIEADAEVWHRLYASYSTRDVQCLFGRTSDLDRALKFSQFRYITSPDLGIIDIDGQDYWLWHDMVKYRPRVLMIETNYQTWDAIPERGGQGQAGLASINSLGEDKGYTLVAHTYCNAIFVKTEELN